jgi:hypothetical protein
MARAPFWRTGKSSAWGRAIVAALAADTRRGIASAEEVRSAHSRDRPDHPEVSFGERFPDAVAELAAERDLDAAELCRSILAEATDGRVSSPEELSASEEDAVRAVFHTANDGVKRGRARFLPALRRQH